MTYNFSNFLVFFRASLDAFTDALSPCVMFAFACSTDSADTSFKASVGKWALFIASTCFGVPAAEKTGVLTAADSSNSASNMPLFELGGSGTMAGEASAQASICFRSRPSGLPF